MPIVAGFALVTNQVAAELDASVSVVTQTIFTGPTGLVQQPPASKSSIPVGPIVGGAVGGVVIAVVAVTLWAWWGRSIQRKQAQQRKEMRELLAVRENTRRNAGLITRSRSRSRYGRGAAGINADHVSRHPLRRDTRQIKFAEVPSEKMLEKRPFRTLSPTPSPSPSPPPPSAPLVISSDGIARPPSSQTATTPPTTPNRAHPNRTPRTPWGTSVLPSEGPVIMPRPKIPRPDPVQRAESEKYQALGANGAGGNVQSDRAVPSTLTGGERTGLHTPGRSLRHMPSAVSSDSDYSTQSGEQRRERAAGIFAALRHGLDLNRHSTFSIGSLYSVEE